MKGIFFKIFFIMQQRT